MDKWKKASGSWVDYPIGTIAKQSSCGSTWVKHERGWALTTNGALFSKPCNADLVKVQGVK